MVEVSKKYTAIMKEKKRKQPGVLVARFALVLLIILGSFWVSAGVHATSGINKEISYAGVLKSAAGIIVADGSYDMVFNIYDTDETVLWTGQYTALNGNPVRVKGGNFEVLLGSGTGNDIAVDFTQDEYYLGLTIGTDSEMTPRQKFGSAPYAFNADAVDGTSIYKVIGDPNGVQSGTVGDIALDMTNTTLYIKISGIKTTSGWAALSGTTAAETGDITSPTDGVTITGGTGAVFGDGVTISIANADGTQTGLLSSTDHAIFSAKEDALTFSGPLSRDADVVSLVMADASNDGYLDAGDWSSFNAKENALTFSGPVSRVGDTISITQADGSTDGYLSFGDWTAFSTKEDALTFSGPLSRTDDTISLHIADVSNDGYLGASDWAAFSAKENALTFSGPISRIADTISVDQADGSTDGYLAFGDWTSFSAKEDALTFSGPLSRDADVVSLVMADASNDGYLDASDWSAFNSKVSSQWTTDGPAITYDGYVGIGAAEPSAQLHLGAGTATAGTASLKIDVGVLLDAAEIGAIEFDGASLYYTDSDGERHTLAKDEVLFNTPIYSSTITYQHARDPEELDGTASYTHASFATYGMYEQMTADTTVSAIKANVWCNNASRDITFKVFVRDTTAVFNPDSVTPTYSGTISAASMPHSSTSGGSLFTMTDSITALEGQYLFVLWESTVGGEVTIAHFSTVSSSPSRHGFIAGATNTNFFVTSPPTYYAATFRVYGDTDITRTTVTVAGVEQFSNTGFETAGAGGSDIWANWAETIMSGGTIADETTSVHAGSHAAKLTSSGINWFSPQLTYNSFAVTPGQLYQLSFWTRGDGTHAGKYSLLDATHSTYINSSSGGLTTGVTGTTYTQVTTTFEAPADCTAVTFIFVPDNTAASYVAYFDDISLKLLTDVEELVPLSIETIFNNLPSTAITFSDPDDVMTSTNVRDAIIEAYNHNPAAEIVAPQIVLPDTIYAVVGDKLQLYVRGMIEAQNPYNLPYVITCAVGSSYPRYFEYTPVEANVGTTDFTVTVYNYDYSILATKTVDLVTVNPTGEPVANKNILVVGDSVTATGTWPTELYRRLTQSGGSPAGLGYGNISFIGEKAMSAYPTQAYTGNGGWTFANYNGTSGITNGHVLTGTFDKDKTDVTSAWLDTNGHYWYIVSVTGGLKIYGSYTLPASGTLTHVSGATHTADIVYTSATTEPQSPFWDSGADEMSFSSWVTRHGYSGIDAAYIILGWNSNSVPNATDFTTYMTDVTAFLDKLHAEYPSAIARIIGIHLPSVDGGLGTNYGANGGYSNYYGMIRAANAMNDAYQDLANSATYSSWVKFTSLAPEFDSENNYPQTDVAVNTRSATTEKRETNGLHPLTEGYYQMADVVYREFVNTFVSD